MSHSLLIRPIVVFLISVGCSMPVLSQTTTSSPASSCYDDPLIMLLDSMSYSLFTRDKFFESDERVLESINMPYDLIPKYTEEEIREKMTLIPAEFPMAYNSHVKAFIEMFAYRRRGLVTRCLANAQIYFPVFEEILDRKGLPLELKYLPIVESAFNPIAVSRAGATGLWQLMYGTGTMLGLSVNTYIDERRDPVLATYAAAEFLRKLYSMYGDWHLVLAAYNSGPGNVNKAIARAGGIKNFWAIMNYLPAETRSYVPSFIAAVYVMEYHKDFHIVSAEPKRELYSVDTVLITSKVSLKHISNVLSIPEDELQFLNPSIKKGIIPYTQNGFPLNLPVSYFAAFETRKEEIMNDTTMALQVVETAVSAKPKLIYYAVRRNETINKIAAKYNVSVSEIKKWNRLKDSRLYSGQKLKIYTQPESAPALCYVQAFSSKIVEKTKSDTVSVEALTATADSVADSTSSSKATPAPVKSAPAGNVVYYKVQPGDTLWGIARKYAGVTVEKLKKDNKQYADKPLKVGDVVKVSR